MTTAEFRDARHLGNLRIARLSIKEVLDDEEECIIPAEELRAAMVTLRKWESTLDDRITIRDRKPKSNGAAGLGGIWIMADDNVEVISNEKHPDCPNCILIRTKHGGLGPPHDGSKSCESGSIASGGKNAHCACDICF